MNRRELLKYTGVAAAGTASLAVASLPAVVGAAPVTGGKIPDICARAAKEMGFRFLGFHTADPGKNLENGEAVAFACTTLNNQGDKLLPAYRVVMKDGNLFSQATAMVESLERQTNQVESLKDLMRLALVHADIQRIHLSYLPESFELDMPFPCAHLTTGMPFGNWYEVTWFDEKSHVKFSLKHPKAFYGQPRWMAPAEIHERHADIQAYRKRYPVG